MSGPTEEERACIAGGLRVLEAGATVGAPGEAGYRLSKGIVVMELPTGALYDEQPLDALEMVGRRFLGVSDEAVALFDVSSDGTGPVLLRAAVGHLAERTLDAIEDVGDADAERLVIVRLRGMAAEGLWVRDGGSGVTTIMAPNGAVEGESFIGACRRLFRMAGGSREGDI